jgi:hypothetical protein
MEPAPNKVKIYLGEFVVDHVDTLGAIGFSLGKKAHITMHVGDFPHAVKVGDKIPLFTEITHADVGPTPEQ